MREAEVPRLTIDELLTELVVVGAAERARQRRRAVDRLARERLPHMLARRVEPLLEGKSAVVRIRRLELELHLAAGPRDVVNLAEAWAKTLAAALVDELRRGAGSNVAVFESHPDYLASYVEELAGGGSSDAWAFDDFSALRHLRSGEAAVEALCARPTWLPAVARRLLRSARLAGFLRMVGNAGARRVLETAAGSAPPEAAPADLVALADHAEHPDVAGLGPHAVALGLVLLDSAPADPPERVSAAASAALALARCREAATELSEPARQVFLLALETGADPPGLPADALEPVLGAARSAPGAGAALGRAVLGFAKELLQPREADGGS